jgi:hypothetical protein
MEPGFDQNYWNKMQNVPDRLESQSFSKSTLCRKSAEHVSLVQMNIQIF